MSRRNCPSTLCIISFDQSSTKSTIGLFTGRSRAWYFKSGHPMLYGNKKAYYKTNKYENKAKTNTAVGKKVASNCEIAPPLTNSQVSMFEHSLFATCHNNILHEQHINSITPCSNSPCMQTHSSHCLRSPMRNQTLHPSTRLDLCPHCF